MSTLTYRASGRYQFGWSDPRVNTATSFDMLEYPLDMHFCVEMTDEQIAAAWVLNYGDRPITFVEMVDRKHEDPDSFRIAVEAHSRKLLLSQHDFSSISDIYILKDKLNASS